MLNPKNPNILPTDSLPPTASNFLDQLRKGQTSVVEYAARCAQRIAEREPSLHAFAWYDPSRMLQAALNADERLAAHRKTTDNPSALDGLITGVPIGVKDVFNTNDMPTQHGSAAFADFTPGNDARVVFDIHFQGGIVAGKTATAEFAVHHPTGTVNPLDPNRSCGTSSAGSAVAVATGMVPIALTTQTGGSTIRPASYVGVHGFKPSFGLLPRTGMLKSSDTLDSIGFVARSVADLGLFLDVTRISGPNYPYVDAAFSDTTRTQRPSRPWRVGILDGPRSAEESQAASTGVRRVADRLSNAGMHVERFVLPPEFNQAHDLHNTIYTKSVAYNYRMEWARAANSFSPILAAMMKSGAEIPVADYQNALQQQTNLAALYDTALLSVDVLICPSTADEAPVGIDATDTPDHCLIFTMSYAPVLGLPLLRGSTGLPLGLQVAGRRYNDLQLLKFAEDVEEIFS